MSKAKEIETMTLSHRIEMDKNFGLWRTEEARLRRELASREERAKYLEDDLTMTKQELQEKAAMILSLRAGIAQQGGTYTDEMNRLQGAFISQEASLETLRNECGELVRQRDAALSASTPPKSGESWSVVNTPRGKAEMENLKKELSQAAGERAIWDEARAAKVDAQNPRSNQIHALKSSTWSRTRTSSDKRPQSCQSARNAWSKTSH